MNEHETSPVEQWETIEIQTRPRWPKVIGIISIVWGSLGLVCGGLGLIALPFSSKFVGMALKDGEPVPYGMVPSGSDYAIATIGLGMTLLLLFAGIACVSYRPITRMMHIAYAMLGIPLVVWQYLNQLHKQELNAQWAKEFPDSAMAPGFAQSASGSATPSQLIGLVLLIVLGFGIPLFYLIWFGLVKTKPEQITGGDISVY